jgi:CDP-4-dehydro-6-deoxyglucose reductase
LSLDIPGIDALAYRPGQHLKLRAPDGRSRSFSMASAPSQNVVDLHIRRVPGGWFTDGWMPGLKPGDRVEVELPLGNFFYRAADYRPLIMIATGTGLAPIKSILESLMDDPDCPPVSLYWGGRQSADLYLGEQIATWGERLYDFQYVPVLSRPEAGWAGRSGYVQDAVAADLADLAEHAIYLCGSPTMIQGARNRFISLGASTAHIYTDSFTFQSI